MAESIVYSCGSMLVRVNLRAPVHSQSNTKTLPTTLRLAASTTSASSQPGSRITRRRTQRRKQTATHVKILDTGRQHGVKLGEWLYLTRKVIIVPHIVSGRFAMGSCSSGSGAFSSIFSTDSVKPSRFAFDVDEKFTYASATNSYWGIRLYNSPLRVRHMARRDGC